MINAPSRTAEKYLLAVTGDGSVRRSGTVPDREQRRPRRHDVDDAFDGIRVKGNTARPGIGKVLQTITLTTMLPPAIEEFYPFPFSRTRKGI
jgi:hypothetical protein